MARYPKATWRGSPNHYEGNETPRYVVLHVEEGTEAGTRSWFGETRSQASAHFGVAKDGSVDQFVDTKDGAWAEAAGNPYGISIETEGQDSEPLTEAQVEAIAEIYAWVHKEHGVKVQRTQDPEHGEGFIAHGEGGQAWGGHISCPGDKRKAQMPEILKKVEALLGETPKAEPKPAPKTKEKPKPAPAAHPGSGTPAWYHRVLKNGDRGSDVKTAQVRLGTPADGIFGPHTEATVRVFQHSHGLTVDGVIGPQTARLLG